MAQYNSAPVGLLAEGSRYSRGALSSTGAPHTRLTISVCVLAPNISNVICNATSSKTFR